MIQYTTMSEKSMVEVEAELLTPTEAGMRLGLSADMVRHLGNSGKLPCLRTASGRRLFRAIDVAALAASRAASRTPHPT